MTELKRGLAGVYIDRSAITDIDPEEGALRHRGYAIDELAAHPLERTMWLALYGEWPNEAEYWCYRRRLAGMRTLPSHVEALVDRLASLPPHDVLLAAVSVLNCRLASPASDDAARREVLEDIVASIPRVIASQAARREGRAFPKPRPELDQASDFLSALLGRSIRSSESRAINAALVMHVDHGANASSFAARVAASTGADVVAAMCAGLATFPGPLHGGAVAGVLDVLNRVHSPDEIAAFVERERRAKRPIPGFGHRVYRGADPRRKPFRELACQLATSPEQQRQVELLDAWVVAMKPFERFGIGPNVDLYAALVYRLLGIPDDFAISIYIAGRCVGWAAQILEQLENNVLIRPRLAYDGEPARPLPETALRIGA